MCEALSSISSTCKVFCHVAKKDKEIISDLVFIAISIILGVGFLIAGWCNGQQLVFPNQASAWFFYFSSVIVGLFMLSRIWAICDRVFEKINLHNAESNTNV